MKGIDANIGSHLNTYMKINEKEALKAIEETENVMEQSLNVLDNALNIKENYSPLYAKAALLANKNWLSSFKEATKKFYKPRFVMDQPVTFEENRPYEFKEVKSKNPVAAISNAADEYAVAFLNDEDKGGRIYWGIKDEDGAVVGVNLNYKQRNDLRQAVSQKFNQIQPSVALSSFRINIESIACGEEVVKDKYVVEIIIQKGWGSPRALYATGEGEVFIKTDGGKTKLSHTQVQQEIAKRMANK